MTPPLIEEYNIPDLLEATKRTARDLLAGDREEFRDPVLELLEHETYGQILSRAPASSSFSRHHCFTGGLLYHSLEVFMLAQDACHVGGGDEESHADIFLASILHDFNKVCDPLGHPFYEENILRSGEVSDRKPWKSSDEWLQDPTDSVMWEQISNECGEGVAKQLKLMAELTQDRAKKISGGKVSYYTLCCIDPRFRELPDDVKQAILYHDGGYGDGKYELNGGESKLTILIHTADMLSSRFEGQFPQANPRTFLAMPDGETTQTQDNNESE